MATWAYTFDADLDLVLQAAHNDELEPLVLLLSKDHSGKPLSSCPEYARFYPDHRRYIHLISVKLRALGGHRMGNLLRLGQGPSYLTVVKSVAEHLKVPFAQDDGIVALEQKLLYHVMSGCYQDLSESEQKQLTAALTADDNSTAQASSTALVAVEQGDYSKLSAQGRLLVATMVSQAVGKVVGFSLESWNTVNTVVGKSWTQLNASLTATMVRLTALMQGLVGRPSYQILVPCVLHIASLRLMQAGTKLEAPDPAALAHQAAPQ